ncbi:MAG TPA: TonB family protein [Candidatus Acidoferrales bacterium]|nr:TonB family protein [Candidatus Acidoferrales bacterium]
MQDEKFLNNCLMDSDGEVRIRATHRRQRATVIALSVEAALVVGLALWPIVTTGSSPAEIVMLPRIPYRGSNAPRPDTAPPPSRPARPQQISTILLQPPQRIPVHIDRASSATTRSVAAPAIQGPDLWDTSQTPGVATGTGNDSSMIPLPRPSGPRIIQQSEGVQSGLLVYRVDPRYPQIAINAGISGTVELRAIIGRDGRVRSVEMLSGSALLAPAAVAAVREWRYRPTLLNGEAVEVETHVTVHFVLGQ